MRNPIEQFNERKLRNLLRRGFEPDKKFLKSLRAKFQQEVDTGFTPARTPIHHHVIRWRYALVVILIIILSTAGAMTYADTADVGPTHPLYQFKRMGEQIQLDFSTPQQKVELHQLFAQRRAREIQELRAASQSMNLIPGLANDFQEEANQTLNQAQQLNYEKSKRLMICQSILNAIDHSVQADKVSQIQIHCQQFEQ